MTTTELPADEAYARDLTDLVTRINFFVYAGERTEAIISTIKALRADEMLASRLLGRQDADRRFAVLTQFALDKLWEDGACCPRCCPACSVLKDMLDADVLDDVAQGWPDHLIGTAWWTDGNEVDREFLARAWAGADRRHAACHDDGAETGEA